MIRSSVSYTKNNLSALLQRVREGEVVEITDRDRPVARLVPIDELNLTSHQREMIRKGLLRPPLTPFNPELIQTVELENGGPVNLVEALIEERDSGW